MESNIVGNWLRSLRLEQYAESFLDNGYDDLEICKQVGQPDLDAIGMFDAEHRAVLLKAVKRLQQRGGARVYFILDPDYQLGQSDDDDDDDDDDDGEFEDNEYDEDVDENSRDCGGGGGGDCEVDIFTGKQYQQYHQQHYQQYQQYHHQQQQQHQQHQQQHQQRVVTYSKSQLMAILKGKILQDKHCIRPLLKLPQCRRETAIRSVASRYASDLFTRRGDVEQVTFTLLTKDDPDNILSDLFLRPSASTAPPVTPPQSSVAAAAALVSALRESSPVGSRRLSIPGSGDSEEQRSLLPHKQLPGCCKPDRKSSTLARVIRYVGSRRRASRGRKCPTTTTTTAAATATTTGDELGMRASELTMSERERIELMLLVKQGRLSGAEAVRLVRVYEQRRKAAGEAERAANVAAANVATSPPLQIATLRRSNTRSPPQQQQQQHQQHQQFQQQQLMQFQQQQLQQFQEQQQQQHQQQILNPAGGPTNSLSDCRLSEHLLAPAWCRPPAYHHRQEHLAETSTCGTCDTSHWLSPRPARPEVAREHSSTDAFVSPFTNRKGTNESPSPVPPEESAAVGNFIAIGNNPDRRRHVAATAAIPAKPVINPLDYTIARSRIPKVSSKAHDPKQQFLKFPENDQETGPDLGLQADSSPNGTIDSSDELGSASTSIGSESSPRRQKLKNSISDRGQYEEVKDGKNCQRKANGGVSAACKHQQQKHQQQKHQQQKHQQQQKKQQQQDWDSEGRDSAYGSPRRRRSRTEQRTRAHDLSELLERLQLGHIRSRLQQVRVTSLSSFSELNPGDLDLIGVECASERARLLRAAEMIRHGRARTSRVASSDSSQETAEPAASERGDEAVAVRDHV